MTAEPTPAAPYLADAETIAPPPFPSAVNGPAATTLPPPAIAPVAQAGPAVAGYELLGELGRGGMGVVYKARQTRLGRLVALKMILSGGHAGEGDLARFRTEGEAIARLQHPNIVQVFEVGEQGGLPYFSLEYCPGGSLEKKLNGTPLPPKQAAALVETLARAMHAAHEQGVVHRDLKPANVLLAADGTPKVTDFGLAKKLDAVGQTASGAVMGTPSYMAPEQAGGQGGKTGPAADVYALGAILYECLTGRPPFKAATALDTIMQVVSDEPVPPTALQSRTPRDLETVCLKCLRKEPARRYASAAALADDLRRFQEGRPILARPVGRAERVAKWVRRNPVLAGMTALVVLTLLGATGVSTGFGIAARRQAELAEKNAELAKKNAADAVAKGEELATAAELAKKNAADAVAKGKELATANASLTRTAMAMADVIQAKDALEAGAAAGNLMEAMKDTRDPLALYFLARGLSLVASRMEPRDAAPVIAQATTILAQAMKDTREPYALSSLAQGLSALASRMEPRDAASVTAQAATTLAQVMKDTRKPLALSLLAHGLSALAFRMEPRDATSVTAQAAVFLMEGSSRAQTLSALLSAVPLAEIPTRSAMATSAVASSAGSGHPLTALASLIRAAEPPPGRLSPQQLVDLLKMPSCAGEARRVVLDHLGNHYGRRFADPAEFERFAKEQKLDLDLTTPPQRPEPGAAAAPKP